MDQEEEQDLRSPTTNKYPQPRQLQRDCIGKAGSVADFSKILFPSASGRSSSAADKRLIKQLRCLERQPPSWDDLLAGSSWPRLCRGRSSASSESIRSSCGSPCEKSAGRCSAETRDLLCQSPDPSRPSERPPMSYPARHQPTRLSSPSPPSREPPRAHSVEGR